MKLLYGTLSNLLLTMLLFVLKMKCFLLEVVIIMDIMDILKRLVGSNKNLRFCLWCQYKSIDRLLVLLMIIKFGLLEGVEAAALEVAFVNLISLLCSDNCWKVNASIKILLLFIYLKKTIFYELGLAIMDEEGLQPKFLSWRRKKY